MNLQMHNMGSFFSSFKFANIASAYSSVIFTLIATTFNHLSPAFSATNI